MIQENNSLLTFKDIVLINTPSFNLIKFISFSFFFVVSGKILCQTNTDSSNYYNFFDSIIGEENSSLYNGSLFVDDFIIINDKHRFFNSSGFILGNITYDGQIYYDQRLKYDLYEDEILVNPKGTSKSWAIRLRKSKVDDFYLDNHRFIKAGKIGDISLSYDLGFCEVLLEKNFVFLLKKHEKRVTQKDNEEIAYQEFDVKINYYLFFNQKYYDVNSQRGWSLIFPKNKKEIKVFYKSYKQMRKSDVDAFMKLIFERFVPISN